MILSNFLYRIRQYVYENRARMIRALLIAAGALIVAALIYYGAEQWVQLRSERKVRAFEALEREASARAKSLEAEAAALKLAKDALEVERRDLERRAADAELKLLLSRRAVEPLKEAYEEARSNLADVPVDTTCADACARLAELGYACK